MAYTITAGENLKIYYRYRDIDEPVDSVPSGSKFYLYGSAPREAFTYSKKANFKESTIIEDDGGLGPSSLTDYDYTGSANLQSSPLLLSDSYIQSMLAMGDKKTNIIGAVFTAATGRIDFSGSTVIPSIRSGETVRWYDSDIAWNNIPMILTSTATANVYDVHPAPATDRTFALFAGNTPELIQGGVQFPNASMAGVWVDGFEAWQAETAGTGHTSIEGAVIAVAGGGTIDFTAVDDATRPWGIVSGLPYLIRGTANSGANNGIYYLTETAAAGVYSMSPTPVADETVGATGKLHGDAFVTCNRQKEIDFLLHDENLDIREYCIGVQITSLDNSQPQGDVETAAINFSGRNKLVKKNGLSYGEVLIDPGLSYNAFTTGRDPNDSSRRSDGLLLIKSLDTVISCALITSSLKIERTIEKRRGQKTAAVCGYSLTGYKVTMPITLYRYDMSFYEDMDARTAVQVFCSTVNLDGIWYAYDAQYATIDGVEMPYAAGNPTVSVDITANRNKKYGSMYQGRVAIMRYREDTPV